ncbi:MAG: amino acid permease [Proteobacteria bacterium]|nr:amino acid permease [Pseudomonadota bacterium]
MNLFRTQPLSAHPHVDAGEPVEGSLEGEVSFRRVLTARHLVMLGIGAVIGAGIFVMTGKAAADHAGPAIMLSFVLAGFACALAGLCYAEFAAMLPVSGSAYSYAYATLGEFVAWFIGWNLVLEYMFAAATVAVGWSGYLTGLLDSLTGMTGIPLSIPAALTSAPLNVVDGRLIPTGAMLNLPAVLIVAAISALCYRGITQSASVNAVIVAIKIVVILLFLAFSLQYVDPDNWAPFIPPAEGPGKFGWDGMVRGASIVFFAYIGFDAVSTAAQEAKNPQRDMPIGILGSLAICTVLYMAVAAVLTGMLPFRMLGTAKPVATALEAYPSLLWLKTLVEIGAIAGLSSAAAHLLHHVARRPDTAPVCPRASRVPDPARRHRGGRRHRCDAGRIAAHRYPGRPGLDGHAARIRYRLRRGADPEAHAPAGDATLPRPVRLVRVDWRRRELPLAVLARLHR